jgi:hypothetical protein
LENRPKCFKQLGKIEELALGPFWNLGVKHNYILLNIRPKLLLHLHKTIFLKKKQLINAPSFNRSLLSVPTPLERDLVIHHELFLKKIHQEIKMDSDLRMTSK